MVKNNHGNCEDCGEPIEQNGYQLYCVNGCFEDDVRNGYSEDEFGYIYNEVL